MSSYHKYLAYFTLSFKRNLREPAAVFFTLVFPLILLVFFGEFVVSSGGAIAYFVPLWCTLILLTAAIFNIPFDITGHRDDGTFKRLYSTPVKMKYVVVCLMLSNILFALVSMLLLGSAAAVIHTYRLQMDWRYTGHAIAAFFCLLPLGVLISFIARSARGNMMISMALFYPLCMLSGLFIPYPMLPQKFQSAAFYLPVPHIFSVFLAFTSDIGPIFPQKQSAVVLAVYTAVFSILLPVFRRGSRFLND